ncbi:YcxB family protein [Planctomicrobium sp. SH661]|uniref:YcxB family protein n=1 Tax=Planctomicrobium sp. SH661 TaxID=3448124 RepID=UPI003F5C05DB
MQMHLSTEHVYPLVHFPAPIGLNMHIDFNVTAEDYLAFLEYLLAKSPTFRRQKLRGALLACLILSILPFMILRGNQKPLLQTAAAIWPLLIGPLVVIPLYYVMINRTARRAMREMSQGPEAQGVLGAKSISLGDEGLIERSESGEQRVNWTAIKNLAVGARRLFIVLDNASGFVIPVDAFDSEQKFQDFLAELTRYTKLTPEVIK